jgi:hypothetical protein
VVPTETEDRGPIPGEKEEDDVLDIDSEQEVLPLHYEITSYGADFLVDGLVSRLNSDDIVIPTFDPDFESGSDLTGFQRGYIWSKPQADKFLESLLLGMPVPGIFLIREPDGVFMVLDGHQRLQTLQSFYRGLFRGKEYRLEYIQEPWPSKNYADLDGEDRRRLDSSIIHATILRQDHPERDYSAIYSIFERINSGGTPLQPQEIRVALFGGPFINLLRELNVNDDWRDLYGPKSSRLKDQELLLRFFALLDRGDNYTRPLKGFLNEFLADNRDQTRAKSKALINTFEGTVAAINKAIGTTAFRPVRSLNAAVFDGVMIGVARRVAEVGPLSDLSTLKKQYNRLLKNQRFLDATSSSTAAEESVKTRLSLATSAFRNVT